MARASLVLLLLAACGTSPDERPVTFEYVSLGILAPTCGQVQCHSSTTKTEGYSFDTLEGSRKALTRLTEGTDDENDLVRVITADDGDRMPPDSPLNDEDIALIRAWIASGKQGL